MDNTTSTVTRGDQMGALYIKVLRSIDTLCRRDGGVYNEIRMHFGRQMSTHFRQRSEPDQEAVLKSAMSSYVKVLVMRLSDLVRTRALTRSLSNGLLGDMVKSLIVMEGPWMWNLETLPPLELRHVRTAAHTVTSMLLLSMEKDLMSKRVLNANNGVDSMLICIMYATELFVDEVPLDAMVVEYCVPQPLVEIDVNWK